MNSPYNSNFYRDIHRKSHYAAEKVLSLVAEVMPKMHSAIDVGCGVGTWLDVLSKRGVKDILGIDGSWVDKSMLTIPEDCFFEHDFQKGPLQVPRRYDLAISLEVAEHLSPEIANDFVVTLTKLSDVVLFSAAIPYQGGTAHINEQWPDYWATKFKEKGYQLFDVIRPQIWNDDRIRVWYKQNILLFVCDQKVDELELGSYSARDSPLCIVHPQKYMDEMAYSRCLLGSSKLFFRALRRKLCSMLGFAEK